MRVTLLPDKKHRLETKIKRRTLNPRWNETFYFEGKATWRSIFPFSNFSSNSRHQSWAFSKRNTAFIYKSTSVAPLVDVLSTTQTLKLKTHRQQMALNGKWRWGNSADPKAEKKNFGFNQMSRIVWCCPLFQQFFSIFTFFLACCGTLLYVADRWLN